MNHDECAYGACGDAPAGLPDHVVLFVFADEFDVEDLGEVLTEVVAGSHLQCFAVRHHSFQRGGVVGSSEFFAVTLDADDDGDGEVVFHDVSVFVEGVQDFFFGFFFGGVGGVAFLPEELAGSQEQLGGFGFPADDVAPLINLQRAGRASCVSTSRTSRT